MDLLTDLVKSLQQFESSKEIRLVNRVSSQFSALRKLLICSSSSPISCPLTLDSQIRKFIDESFPSPIFSYSSSATQEQRDLIQVECLYTLIAVCLPLDNANCKQLTSNAAAFCTKALDYFFNQVNARYLDGMLDKLCFFHSRLFESTSELKQILPIQLNLLRISSLHRDTQCELMLTHLILRNYLSRNLYEVADKFAAKMLSSQVFASKQTSHSLSGSASFIKFLFYVGCVEAIKLNYSKANEHLTLALRKAPSSAKGFQQICAKFLVVVQLLMGDVPDRSLFVNHSGMQPYLKISECVHQGNSDSFQSILTNQPEIVDGLKRDRTLSLVLRLRHNVIKTAVKRANIAYSNISMTDLARKIFPHYSSNHKMDGTEAEFIAVKCIKDGVIDAFVSHTSAKQNESNSPCLHSKDVLDVYGSAEASMNIGKRIEFCLQTRRDAMKAMRYESSENKQNESTASLTCDDLVVEGDGSLDGIDDNEMDF